MNSLAIKLDVSGDNQRTLNTLLETVGIKPQRRRFHCTVGFIDKGFESVTDAEEFVEELTPKLSLPTPLPFGIQDVCFLFRHVIALLPNEETVDALSIINNHVLQQVNSLTSGNPTLNSQTTGDGFHPHITLWRQRHKDRRVKQARHEVMDGKGLNLEIVKYSYTIL